MKVICHGIDLVDCRRIERLRRDHGRRFLSRIFTERELRYCRSHRYQAERLGGRFAVKEAVMKMLGTGWQNGGAKAMRIPRGRRKTEAAMSSRQMEAAVKALGGASVVSRELCISRRQVHRYVDGSQAVGADLRDRIQKLLHGRNFNLDEGSFDT